MNSKYSIFSFGGYSVEIQGSVSSYSGMHLSYDLWMPEEKRRGHIKRHYLARIWLHPNNPLIHESMKNQSRGQKSYSEKMISFLYNDRVLYNWGAGYLKVVNDHLKDGHERGPFSENTDKKALAKLKTDTLYIPDYVSIRYSPFTGAEQKKPLDLEKLRKDYPYPFKLVSAEELNKDILSGQAKKYLVYVKSSTDKFIDVYDGQTGNLLYSRYIKISYNFKVKNLKDLSRAIK